MPTEDRRRAIYEHRCGADTSDDGLVGAVSDFADQIEMLGIGELAKDEDD